MMDAATRTRLIRSLCIAEAVFAALYFGANLYTHYRPLMTGQGLAILLWNLDVSLAPLITGSVAALVYGNRRMVLGISAGLLAGCIAVTSNLYTLGPQAALRNAPWLLLYCAFLGGIGGLLAWFQVLVRKYPRGSA